MLTSANKLLPPLSVITMSLSALAVSPPTFRFFTKLPSALVRFNILPLLSINEQVMSARISTAFPKQVALSNGDIPFMQKGSALLEARWCLAGSNVQQVQILKLLCQPYGLLIIGECLLSLDQLLHICEPPKLTLLMTPFGIQALRNKSLTLTQIQEWDEPVLLVKIGDSKAYHQRLGTFNALAAFLMKYPTYVDSLLQRFRADEILFGPALIDIYWLTELAKKSPIIAEQLFSAVYHCPSAFTRLLSSALVLKKIVQAFPAWQDKLLYYLLTQNQEFERLIGVAANLIQLAEDIPAYQAGLIDFVLSHDAQFQRLLFNHYAFVQVARFFVLATDRLMDRALMPQMIKIFFDDNDDLINFIGQIPSQAEKVLRHVLANKADFHRLIQYHHELIGTATACPGMADALIEYVLQDNDEFDRLVTSRHIVAECLSQFPHHEQAIHDAWFLQDDINKLMSSP